MNEQKRKCYACKRKLNPEEFILSNPHLEESYLMDIWNEETIELYCCKCFAKEKFHSLTIFKKDLKISSMKSNFGKKKFPGKNQFFPSKLHLPILPEKPHSYIPRHKFFFNPFNKQVHNVDKRRKSKNSKTT